MNYLQQYQNQINALCKKHKVKTLYAFGSVLTDRFNENSDVDFLVDFKKMSSVDYADNYFDLADNFETIFQRPVDLITQKSLKNPYFINSVHSSKQLIYG